MIQDISAGLRQYLIEDQELNSYTEGRVFVGDLPEEIHTKMPIACVVIRETGGDGIRSYQPYQSPRFNIFCYGASRYEAGQVDNAVWQRLHYLERAVANETLLHSAVLFGARLFKAADTGWPVKHRQCLVTASTQQAT